MLCHYTRSILSTWYGDEAILVDTFEKIDNNSGIGRLIVTKKHTKGHFNEVIGTSVFPGHKMIEASAQVLGLIAFGDKITKDNMPVSQGVDGLIEYLKPACSEDILQIRGRITGTTRNGFSGNAKVFNQKQEVVAEINGLEAVVMKL